MKALYLKRNRNQWAIVLYSSLLIIVERVVPYKMLNPMFHLQPFDTHIDSQSMACRISVSPWGLAKCGSGSLHQIWSVRALGTRPSYWTFHLSSGMDAEFDLCLVSRPLRSTTRKKSALSHIWYLKFILKALAVGRHDWWAPPPPRVPVNDSRLFWSEAVFLNIDHLLVDGKGSLNSASEPSRCHSPGSAQHLLGKSSQISPLQLASQ